MMTAKDEFIKIYTENISRKGSAELLEWIKKTDFFKHLLADEETGTREIHIAGYIIVKASA